MNPKKFHRYPLLPINCLLLLVLFLTACNPSSTQITDLPPTATSTPATPESTATALEPTQTPEVLLSLNGFPFSFALPARTKGELLWLPAFETFKLLKIPNINRQPDFISGAFTNADGNWVNCHFELGQNSFSTDTANGIWITTELSPYVENGEIYLSQEMIERCFGTVIEFDPEKLTANLIVPVRKLSSVQAGNSSTYEFILQNDYEKLVDTRIGLLVSGVVKDPTDYWMDWADELKEQGFTRARVTLNDGDGPFVDDRLGNIEEEIPADYIAFYQKLHDLGIQTRYSLSFWDLTYQREGGIMDLDRLSSEDEINRYLDYVRMVVTSLKGLVDEYELWNEPDANRDWYQRIEPEDYIAVARQAIPIIREIDPNAKIVLISTSNYVNLPCQDYSNLILESDILSMADAISLHTVNNDASPEFLSDYYYGYEEMWQQIKTKAEAHGFSGEYYADELNYRSEYSLSVLQPEPGNYHPYAPEVAAKYFGRMIAINLGMDITVGTSGADKIGRPIEGNMIQNMAYLMEGLGVFPIEVETISESALLRYYTFIDDTGNTYLVIWNDSVAQIESEDVEAEITMSDVSASEITAFDPFLSTSQTVIYTNTPSGINMTQLMIKDYPLIFKITP